MRTSLAELIEAVKGRKWSVLGEEKQIRCESGLCPMVAAAVELAPEEFAAQLFWIDDADELLSIANSGDTTDAWRANNWYEEAARAIGYRGEADYVVNAADSDSWSDRRVTQIRRIFERELIDDKE